MATEKAALGAADPLSTPKSRRVRLLWLGIDDVSFDQAVERVVEMCGEEGPAYVVTPNVDHFMRTRRDAAFRAIYDNADLCLADGMPVVWASRLLGCALKGKVSGSDMFEALCARAAEEGFPVFFLGGTPGVAEKAKQVLTERHPKLRVAGTHSPQVQTDTEGPEDEETREIVRKAKPQLLFVAFGMPKQEIWMARNYKRMGVPVCIAVGASFDFVAEVQSRAPRWMQRMGLEWSWRLLHEPRRLWKRYLLHDLPFFWYVARAWIRSMLGRRSNQK